MVVAGVSTVAGGLLSLQDLCLLFLVLGPTAPVPQETADVPERQVTIGADGDNAGHYVHVRTHTSVVAIA